MGTVKEDNETLKSASIMFYWFSEKTEELLAAVDDF